ncbi:MAG: acyltransferase family protein [Pseudoxanthomonas sp.]|nr:acyltransferase family protein [Pseudoxanthomonas sp.]
MGHPDSSPPPSPAPTVRDLRIDAAKGIAILLVVIGHARGVPGTLVLLAYSFCVPLFFFLSGWLGRRGRDRPPGQALAAMSRTLLVPYACFFLLAYAYWLLTRHVGEKAARWGDLPWWDPFTGFLTGIGPDLYVQPALWFLPALFTTAMAWLLLARRLRPGMIALLCLPLALLWIAVFPPTRLRLPFGLDVLPVALFFYACGAFASTTLPLPRTIGRGLAGAALLAAPWLWLAWSNGRVDVNQLRFGASGLAFILAALCGTGVVLMASPLAARSAALCWIGRNSLLILCTHFLVFFVLSGVASLAGLFAHDARPGLAWALSISAIAVAACVPMRAVLVRHAPWALGLRTPARPPATAVA